MYVCMYIGNSRLNGLSLRLVRDLEAVLPASLASCVNIVDPRLMTGRTDAVIGAAYVRKWSSATWTTRRDYILRGVGEPSSSHPDTGGIRTQSDDTGSVVSSSTAPTADDVVPPDVKDCFGNGLSSAGHFSKVPADKRSVPLPDINRCSSPAVVESSDIDLCHDIVSSIL